MTVCSICGKPVTQDNPIIHENGVATHVKCVVPPVITIGSTQREAPAPARAADDTDPMPFWKPKGW